MPILGRSPRSGSRINRRHNNDPAIRRRSKPRNGFLWIGLFAGALDTAGNLFYILAARAGRLDVAAMVASLYPAVTILLAALVLREHPGRRQLAGMALALAAVLLLSL